MSQSTPMYGNWRRPQSLGVWRLGIVPTAAMFVGAAVAMVLLVAFGFLVAVVWAVLLAFTLLLLNIRDADHRTPVQNRLARAAWRRRVRSGETSYQSGPAGVVPSGTCQLPGLAAASKLTEHVDALERPYGLVEIPATRHFSVSLRATPSGDALVDEPVTNNWVAHYGQWLQILGTMHGLAGAAVTVSSAPDTGARLAREIHGQIAGDAPPLAAEIMRDLAESSPRGSATVEAWATLTFAAGRYRDASELARTLAPRLPGLAAQLRESGGGAVTPMSAQELCEVTRVAYDPAAGRLIDRARAAGVAPALSWDDVGPTAHRVSWDRYRHDGAMSCVWAMSQAPSADVYHSVLKWLLEPHGDIDRKRVTLLYRPLDPASAARVAEADLRSAEFRATSARRASQRSARDAAAAARTAQDEARGAGLTNFGMLISATVSDEQRLADAVAAIEGMAPAASIRLRRVYGAQDSAFAATLPIGLVLPEHLSLPRALREGL